jgi:hypothetical protein
MDFGLLSVFVTLIAGGSGAAIGWFGAAAILGVVKGGE